MRSPLSALAAAAAVSLTAVAAVCQDTKKQWPDGKTYVAAGAHLYEWDARWGRPLQASSLGAEGDGARRGAQKAADREERRQEGDGGGEGD